MSARLTDNELAAIEAQLDGTVPYYVPALVRELRETRAAIQRWAHLRALYEIDDMAAVNAMVDAADYLAEFATTDVRE